MDKAAFFLALGTLAAGGAGGYAVRDRNLLGPPAPSPDPAAAARGATAAAPPSATAPAAPVVPPCDDMVGTPAACPPPPYSADESGCAPVATKRCEDFKQALKPRVAEHAVACVLALNSTQRCDASRVNLCGHQALMTACPPPEPPFAGTGADDLVTRCQAIVQTCSNTSLRECQTTLSGMTAVGRDRMAQCISAHCADKGLVGCEAVNDTK